MSDGGEAPPHPTRTPDRRPPVLSWRARLEGLQRSVLRQPHVVGLMDGMRAFDRGGGGMLAGALAYFAFFTMVPSLLLFVSLLGILVEDTGLREDLVYALVDQVDPVADVARYVIENLADGGRTGTIIGILGLLWGASGFYGALQGAMERMFPGPGTRDFLQTRLRGLLTVVLILGTLLVAVVLVFLLPLATNWLEGRCLALDGLRNPLIEQLCTIDLVQVSGAVAAVAAMGLAFLIALVVYVGIPTSGPTVAQAFWPAVVVGIVIGLLTSFFGLIAPLLVRHWVALGTVGSVFIALIWFNLVFQALVYGAAFTRIRRDRDRTRSGPPLL